jgi:CRISPR-associated protein Csy1
MVDSIEIVDLEEQASDKFSLAKWVSDAAKRAIQLSITSHPSKFSHPDAKTSSIIANTQCRTDGYLRSGNVNYQNYELDVFGNAAAMDVYKFLALKLSNNKTVLESIEQEDELIKDFFSSIPYLDFNDLRCRFLKIKDSEGNSKTNYLVKQVYFPFEECTYHLLSILTPSGLLTEVKKRIDNLRFSEETKQAKESKRKNECHHVGFTDIYDLTFTCYGGKHPQNISYLNSQNDGKAYLLPSVPPSLERRSTRLPNENFFTQSLYRNKFQESFSSLHKLMQLDINNINIRDAIHNIIRFIVDEILATAFKIRQYDSGWSNNDYYSNLPKSQRVWLDNVYQDERLAQIEWKEGISQEIARWVLKSYEKSILGSYMLGDIELQKISKIVIEAIEQDKEFF